MPGSRPLFLARQSYRRRRLMDAARLLPILAALLFAFPLMWGGAGPGAGTHSTVTDGVYLFGVWAGLIVAAFLMSRALRRAEAEGGGPEGPEE